MCFKIKSLEMDGDYIYFILILIDVESCNKPQKRHCTLYCMCSGVKMNVEINSGGELQQNDPN